MKKHWFLSYPLSAQRRLWSDWADAQADLSLRWAHSHFVGFVMSRIKCRWTKRGTIFAFSRINGSLHVTSLCAQWVAKDPSFLPADSEDSDLTGWMRRLIWVFAGRTCHFVGFVMRRLISSGCIPVLETFRGVLVGGKEMLWKHSVEQIRRVFCDN